MIFAFHKIFFYDIAASLREFSMTEKNSSLKIFSEDNLQRRNILPFYLYKSKKGAKKQHPGEKYFNLFCLLLRELDSRLRGNDRAGSQNNREGLKMKKNSSNNSREKLHHNVVAVILLMFLFVVVSVEKFH